MGSKEIEKLESGTSWTFIGEYGSSKGIESLGRKDAVRDDKTKFEDMNATDKAR